LVKLSAGQEPRNSWFWTGEHVTLPLLQGQVSMPAPQKNQASKGQGSVFINTQLIGPSVEKIEPLSY
jgi:hypothetical protein